MLLDTFLLGSQILQSENPDWNKINGVVMGESERFSYKVLRSRDIVTLLNTLSSDSRDSTVTCVLYNWRTGVAYIKSGFDITDKGDYSRNIEYTTFILNNKIMEFMPKPN